MKKGSVDQRHQAIYPWLGGAVLGGAIFMLLARPLLMKKMEIPTVSTPSAATSSTAVATPSSPSSTFSYFQEHYVGQSGRYARIPQGFCFEGARCGGQDGMSRTIDLQEIPLPIERVRSAVTDYNRVIAYAAHPEKEGGNPCAVPDLFIYEIGYDLRTKGVRALKNDPSMWVCGASRSELTSITDGGRYLQIATVGQSGGARHWVYDIDKEQVDPELTNVYRSETTIYFSAEESNEDRFSMYVSGCSMSELMGDASCEQRLGIYLRNNTTGERVRLTRVESAWKNKGYALSDLRWMRYDNWTGGGTLKLNGDALGMDLTIQGFRAFFPAGWL